MKFAIYTRGLSLGFTLTQTLERPAECTAPVSRQISLYGKPCDVWAFRDTRGRLTKLVVKLERNSQTPAWHDVV